MDRRNFLKAGTASVIVPAVAGTAHAQTPRKRPKMLYVFSDQHRAQSMPGEPFRPAIAPTLAA